MTNIVLSINPALAVKVGQASERLATYGEASYVFKWLFSNKASKPEKSSLPISPPRQVDADINTYSTRALEARATFLPPSSNAVVWLNVFIELDRLIDLEIKNKYKSNLNILTDVRPFILTTVKELLQQIDADPLYAPALVEYFGTYNYNPLSNTMFQVSNLSTGAEEELNNLIEALTEFTLHYFYSEWIPANWKGGVSTVPICVYESSAMIDAIKTHNTKMEFIRKQAFLTAPGGWDIVMQSCKDSVKADAINHHIPPVLPGPLRQPTDITNIKTYCRAKVKTVIEGVVADPKYAPMLSRYFGKHYDKTKLSILANASLNVHSFPMSDRAEIEHSYAFWSNNVSIAFDNAPVKAAVKNYFDNVDPVLVPAFVSDGAARKQVLTQIGDWYKTAIENPADNVLKGLGMVMKDYSNAFAVAPFGAEVKGIVGSPVTRLSGLTTSIATALSVLRQKAPVFQHDAEAWSSCVVLLAFSSDISGSIIMSLVTLFMMFGYKQGEIADILSGLGQPEFSRVYPQIHELIQAGAAFPSEMDRLVRDAGLNDISLDLGLEHAVGEWVGNALKPFADAEQSFKDLAGNIRDTAVGTTQKVINEFTQSAHANEGPNAAVMRGIDIGKKDVNLIPPFDTWFDILSLSAILGPFNDALSAATNGISTTFKNADKALATIEKVYDQPSVYIQNITRVSEDVDKLVNIRKDVLKKVGDILIDGTSGLKTPQFAALAVPLVKGGTEKLRFILNDMIINSPSRPKELDAPYGMIIPIILVGASTLQAPVELVRDALFKMFTITEVKK
jgi:hypothetical protein